MKKIVTFCMVVFLLLPIRATASKNEGHKCRNNHQETAHKCDKSYNRTCGFLVSNQTKKGVLFTIINESGGFAMVSCAPSETEWLNIRLKPGIYVVQTTNFRTGELVSRKEFEVTCQMTKSCRQSDEAVGDIILIEATE